MNNIYLILEELLKEWIYTNDEIIKKLWIHKWTFNRWLENKKVPNNYFSDINKLLWYKYENNKTFRSEDQFFTKPEIAKYCFEKFIQIISELGIDYNEYTFIEPSAWNWVFYDILPLEKRIWIDINPLKKEFIKTDFLDFSPDTIKINNNNNNNINKEEDKYIVIGNPPFWLRWNLAYRFIEHSEKFADIVCFILPPLFDSTGKWSPMIRIFNNTEYKLAYSEALPWNSYIYPNGKEVNVNTIFQIWTKIKKENIKDIFKERNPNVAKDNISIKGIWNIKKEELDKIKSYFKIYSLSDWGTPSTTRNKKMLNSCDIYLPSTLFWEMQTYNSFQELPNKRWYWIVFYNEKIKNLFINNKEWFDIWFKSTNWANNTRNELIENFLIKEIITFKENIKDL